MADILEILNVRVVGDGESYVVLAHGFGSDQTAWNGILAQLTQDYKVVLFDLPCSNRVSPDYFSLSRYATLDSYAFDLLQILDSLNITSCSYIGHSISALVGLLAAFFRPSLFSKLILMGASPSLLNVEGYNGGFDREEIAMLFEWIEASYVAWDFDYPPPEIGPNTPPVVAEFITTFFNMRADVALVVCQSMFRWDFRDFLGMVTNRCFILHTTSDIFVPAAALSYMSAHIGGPTDVIRLETVGHVPHISAPDLTAAAIRQALMAP